VKFAVPELEALPYFTESHQKSWAKPEETFHGGQLAGSGAGLQKVESHLQVTKLWPLKRLNLPMP